MATWIKESKHFCASTGAGISTSAGIPDFRGPDGVWTLAAQGKRRSAPTIDCIQAMPTPSHMALVQLQNVGLLKYLISQNCDGLHRKSGILPEKISELHGNTNLEICSKCGHQYLRDFDACAPYGAKGHQTNRYCDIPTCKGMLEDSCINFGENLPKVPLKRAWDNAAKCDLMLVLGSSLTVSPACSIPASVGKNGKNFVICNLQKTKYDKKATLRVHAKCDKFMELVMHYLGMPIPPFILKRTLKVEFKKEKKIRKLSLYGIDADNITFENIPATFVRGIEATVDKSTLRLKEEPFSISFDQNMKGNAIKTKLFFMGHYNEPPLTLSIPTTHETASLLYKLFYNPLTGEWKVEDPVTTNESDSQSEPMCVEGNQDRNT